MIHQIWMSAKVTTSCCNHYYIATIPVIRLPELECPKCGKFQVPKSFVEINPPPTKEKPQ